MATPDWNLRATARNRDEPGSRFPRRNKGKSKDGKNKQVEKEPELTIVEIAATSRASVDSTEKRGVEGKEAARESPEAEGAKPGLERNDDEGTQKQREEEAVCPLPDKTRRGSAFEARMRHRFRR